MFTGGMVAKGVTLWISDLHSYSSIYYSRFLIYDLISDRVLSGSLS